MGKMDDEGRVDVGDSETSDGEAREVSRNGSCLLGGSFIVILSSEHAKDFFIFPFAFESKLENSCNICVSTT